MNCPAAKTRGKAMFNAGNITLLLFGRGCVLLSVVVLTAAHAADGQEPGGGSPPLHESAPAYTLDDARRWATEVVPTVEQIAGRRFKASPQLKVVTREQLRAHIVNDWSEMFGPAGDTAVAAEHLSATLLGKYDCASKAICLPAGNIHPILRAKDVPASQLEPVMKLVLAHELAHALHDQEVGIAEGFRKRESALEELVAWSAVVEGFGLMMQERVANRLGLGSAAAALDRILPGGHTLAEVKEAPLTIPNAIRALQAWAHPLGRDLLRLRLEQTGTQGLWEWLATPPEALLTRLRATDSRPHVATRAAAGDVLAQLARAIGQPCQDVLNVGGGAEVGRRFFQSLDRATADQAVALVDYVHTYGCTNTSPLFAITLYSTRSDADARRFQPLLEAAIHRMKELLSMNGTLQVRVTEMSHTTAAGKINSLALDLRAGHQSAGRQQIIWFCGGRDCIVHMTSLDRKLSELNQPFIDALRRLEAAPASEAPARPASHPAASAPVSPVPSSAPVEPPEECRAFVERWRGAADWASRKRVAQELLEAGPDGVRAALWLLCDPKIAEDNEQGALLNSVVERMGPSAAPLLLHELTTNPGGPWLRVFQLVKSWPAESLQLFVDAARTSDANTCVRIIRLVGVLHSRSPAIDSLLRWAAGHESAEVRTAAVQAYTSVAYAPIPQEFRPLIHDSDETVRVVAIEAFSRSKVDRGLFEEVLPIALDAKQPDVVRCRAAAAAAASVPPEELDSAARKVEGLIRGAERCFCRGLDRENIPAEFLPRLIRWLPLASEGYHVDSCAPEVLKRVGEPAVEPLLATVQVAELPLASRAAGLLVELQPKGSPATAEAVLVRCNSLAPPPAYVDFSGLFRAAAHFLSPEVSVPLLMSFAEDARWARLGGQAAFEAVGHVRPVTPEVILAVERHLLHEDRLSGTALSVAGQLGRDAAPLVPTVLDLAERTSTPFYALYAVARIGEAEEPEVERLIQLASVDDGHKRRDAMYALARVLANQAEDFPLVILAWRQRPELLAELACVEVKSFGVNVLKMPVDAEPMILPILVEMFVGVRKAPSTGLTEAIASVGAADPTLVAFLRERIAEGHPSRSGRAAALLARLRPITADDVGLILDQLDHELAGVRTGAVEACYWLGPLAAPALERLLSLAATSGDYAQLLSIRALGRLGVDDPRVVSTLTKLGESEYEHIRHTAAGAMAKLAGD